MSVYAMVGITRSKVILNYKDMKMYVIVYICFNLYIIYLSTNIIYMILYIIYIAYLDITVLIV